ncbi:MAG TPA: phosphotransferase [Candidatus Saccharimonadia bacterium]
MSFRSLPDHIFSAYGLQPITVAAPQRGYRNHSYALSLADGRQLNLIQYKRDADITSRIRRANQVGAWAAQAGLPARTPADPRILQAKGRATTYFSLYNYLPGTTIPWEAYTQRHLKLLGLSLGRLHHALRQLPQPNSIQQHLTADELNQQLRLLSSYFNHTPVLSALAGKLRLTVNHSWLEQQATVLQAVSQLPHQQPLHLDFVRSNLLFAPARPSDPLQYEGLALTGILDFEKVAWGHPGLDQARTLAFLLVDCRYKTPRQIRKYFLESGYRKRGGGMIARESRTESPKLLLTELVDYYLFYDFYKFLRHNPYESLPSNQHFRRTVTLLISRQILAPDDTIAKAVSGAVNGNALEEASHRPIRPHDPTRAA